MNLPANIAAAGLQSRDGHPMNSLGEAVNNAMLLVEEQSEQLSGVLPKDYTIFSDELLGELLRIFNNNALDDVGGDVIGRIYEYFLSKFAKNIASDDGVFFTPKSLVKMIVNILEPKSGVLLENCTTSLIRMGRHNGTRARFSGKKGSFEPSCEVNRNMLKSGVDPAILLHRYKSEFDGGLRGDKNQNQNS